MERQNNEADESGRGLFQETQTSKVIRKERRRSSIGEQLISLFKVKKVNHETEVVTSGSADKAENNNVDVITDVSSAHAASVKQKTTNANGNRAVSEPQGNGVDNQKTKATVTAAGPKPLATNQQTDQNIAGANGSRAADNKNGNGNKNMGGNIQIQFKEQQSVGNNEPERPGVSNNSNNLISIWFNVKELELNNIYIEFNQQHLTCKPSPSPSHCSEKDYKNETPYKGTDRRHSLDSVLRMDNIEVKELDEKMIQNCDEKGLTAEDHREFYREAFAMEGFDRWFKLALGVEVVTEWIRPLVEQLVKDEYENFVKKVQPVDFNEEDNKFLEKTHDNMKNMMKESKNLPSYEKHTSKCAGLSAKLEPFFDYLEKRFGDDKTTEKMRMLPLLHTRNIMDKERDRDEEKDQWILACIYMTTGWIITYEGAGANFYDVSNLVSYLRNIKGGSDHFCMTEGKLNDLTGVRNYLLHAKSQTVPENIFPLKLNELVSFVSHVYKEQRQKECVHEKLIGVNEDSIKTTLQKLKYLKEVNIDFVIDGEEKCEPTLNAIKSVSGYEKMEKRREKQKCQELKIPKKNELANIDEELNAIVDNARKAQKVVEKAKNEFENYITFFGTKKERRDDRKKELERLNQKGDVKDNNYFSSGELKQASGAFQTKFRAKMMLSNFSEAFTQAFSNPINPVVGQEANEGQS